MQTCSCTYTDVTSSIHYDHDFVNPDTQVKGAWVDGDTELGDIAANKVNAGVNVPLDSHWNFNLRGNYVGERQLYSQNPLRNQDETIDSFFVFNGALSYGDGPYSVTLKVANLFDTSYFHPGVEQADSGDDFDSRSLGFRNSLIPQPGPVVRHPRQPAVLMTHSRTQPGVTAGDRIGLSALGAACVLVAMLAPAKAATEPERLTSFKAVFMYNFIDYVQWPEETSADVFKVGILGKSPVEGPLREIARKRGAGSRKIQIDVFADIEV